MRNEIIKLVTVTGEELDDSLFPAGATEHTVEVFARVKSVRATEFYEAMRSNINLRYIFAVDPDDYELSAKVTDGKKTRAQYVEYDGERYKVVRTYRTDMGEIELSCEEVE